MPTVRLSNVVASLSHAMDLTEGQAPGHSVRSCAIGMAISEELGLGPDDASTLYYTLLLKDAGCSANAAPVARAFGSDDHPVKRDLKTSLWTSYPTAAAYVARNVGIGRGLGAKARHLFTVARGGSPMAREFTRIRCERGAEIARDIGFGPATSAAIRALDEHWDGGGHPYGISGDTIPLASRIACLAQTIEVFLDRFGLVEAMEVVRRRRGSWFDPELADLVLGWSERTEWWDRVRVLDGGWAITTREPEERVVRVGPEGLDRVAEAFADVIDAKSPYTSDHSRGVARIARRVAADMGQDEATERRLYRAGLLHDIGKLGVSNRILDKPGRLTTDEVEEVRRHPMHSREILAPVEVFSDLLDAACFHHERLDGSGYPWGLSGDALSLECRIVAAADVYEALSATRPYRPSLAPDEVRRRMRGDAGTGLDGDVLDALFDRNPRREATEHFPTDAPARIMLVGA